ncbi:MAG: response regulator [Bacteriovoracaceae bacterium]
MKILYVDDERDLLELAVTFFEEEGLPIETASDYDEALTLIRKNHYDLIISDVRMPSGSGIDLVALVREEKKFSGKLILVSGDIKSRDECKRAGCDFIMNKPIDFFGLIDKARELLESN